MSSLLRGFFKNVLPGSIYRWLVHKSRNPPIGRVDMGDLRSTRPVSNVWGLDRGRPVDRYYIERFLAQYTAGIQGNTLEIGSNTYTVRFGGKNVSKSDVLHVSPDDEQATIVADLRQAPHIPADSFDCIICTQTLQFIFEVEAVIGTLHRILAPGGVLLATFPGISQISRYDMDHWGDYWRFTSASTERLFQKRFNHDHLSIRVYGNVLAATAFLHGLATEELRAEELDVFDPDYEVLIGVRAVKARKPA
jgi:SAM-dependent methyltransferase